MLCINIDGKELQAWPGQSILEVARTAGIHVPTLCHDERLKSYGGCGLCVVEQEGSSKLIRACSTLAEDGMVIYTDTPRLHTSRQTTLALLLSDHRGDCRGPCVLACPAQTDVQGYVGLIANGQYRDAVRLIKEKLPIPASIGRICPHPCEDVCRRGLADEAISIAYLKYFAADQDLNSPEPFMPEKAPASGKKAAIVGAGPAGLTAAYYLAVRGHAVTVYDAMPRAGGMLRYGIPEYRLPKDVLNREIALIEKLGVEFVFNTRIGRDVAMEYLKQHYDSVFIGIGAWKSSAMRCEGENQPGVYGGIDFLRQAALDQPVDIGRRVAVVGGGNTAMDAARTAVRMGAEEVLVLYRRTRAEMPAEDIEIKEAEEEGVSFHYLVAPLEVLAPEGRASAIRLQKMELGEPDASGRRSPVPIPGAEEVMAVDSVISAIGQAVESAGIDGFETDRWGSPVVNMETLQTSDPHIFAGGDGLTGPGIAITAVAHGRKAALAMDAFMMGRPLPAAPPYLAERDDLQAEQFAAVPREARLSMPHLPPELRRNSFAEVNAGFSPPQAEQEAGRCLECGCKDYFECRLIEYAGLYEARPGALEGARHQYEMVDEHPFIERNMEKCILCSQCIRICEEVMGVAALGLVRRGFDSMVMPEFGLPLEQTSCISCGQCVHLCPTGAMVEKYPQVKTVPLASEQHSAICTLCGLGCSQSVHTYGSVALKVVPADTGLLCRKGRFAFAGYAEERITTPWLRRGSELVEASWDEALAALERSLRSIRRRGGPDAIAVSVSPVLSLEQAGLLKNVATRALDCRQFFSFTRNTSRGLEPVLGINRSTAALEELPETDFILLAGSLNESQVAAVQIRRAAEKGARLAVISPEPTLVDDLASFCYCLQNETPGPDQGLALLQEMSAAIIHEELAAMPFVERWSSGFHELKESLAGQPVSVAAVELARAYTSARQAIIVVDGAIVSTAGVEMLAQLAVITGHLNRPRNGIIVVNSDANQPGQWALDIRQCYHQHLDALRGGDIKGLIVHGEDPVGAGLISGDDLARLECLAVISPYWTETAARADIVLPGCTPWETAGSYINYSGRLQRMTAIFTPPAGLEGDELLTRMASWFDITAEAPSMAAVEEYYTRPAYLPAAGEGASYRLYRVKGERLFMPRVSTNPVRNRFASRL